MRSSLPGAYAVGAAGLLLLSACQTAPAAAPTTAATAAPKPSVAAAPSPSSAAPSPSAAVAASPEGLTNYSGTVDSVNGRVVTIATTTAGNAAVTIPESLAFLKEGKGTVSDLKPGLSVGVTGKPDSTALSIRVFPPTQNIRAAQIPMAGANQGNVMTNATIESINGQTMVVALGDQKVTISVPPDTEVLRPEPATLADLTQGRRIQATAMPGPNNTLVATNVYLPGTPPEIAR